MKKFMMCEGTNEEVIMEILLEHDKLKITRDDLVGIKPYSVKKLKNVVSIIKPVNEEVEIYRIGDTMTDNVAIPKPLSHILSSDRLYKYHTTPELEILLIINEGLTKEFGKVKSKEKAKTFAKKYIKYNGRKYDNSSNFYREYYGSRERVELLVNNLIEYKRISKHNKKELVLADLLK